MISTIQNVTPTALVPDSSSAGVSAALPSLWGRDGFSFKDLVDIINPLQQLPVVGTIYRAITGDTISVGSRLLGGGLLGGPVGLASAGINAAVEAGTGEDLGAHVLSALEDNAGSSGSAYGKAANSYASAQKLIPS